MCAVCVSPALEGWPIFILCGAGMQRREGRLTEALRSGRLPFHVLETMRGASPVEGRPALHLRAWKQIVDQDLPGAILLEDGAKLLPGFLGFLAAGGYLHAELTQFSHDQTRVWRWGGSDASPGVRLRPMALSAGLAAAYALSQRGARHLLEARDARVRRCEAPRTRNGGSGAGWPCDISRLGALVSHPQLVQAPQWLCNEAEDQPAAIDHMADPDGGWPEKAAEPYRPGLEGRLRDLARSGLSRQLSVSRH